MALIRYAYTASHRIIRHGGVLCLCAHLHAFITTSPVHFSGPSKSNNHKFWGLLFLSLLTSTLPQQTVAHIMHSISLPYVEAPPVHTSGRHTFWWLAHVSCHSAQHLYPQPPQISAGASPSAHIPTLTHPSQQQPYEHTGSALYQCTHTNIQQTLYQSEAHPPSPRQKCRQLRTSRLGSWLTGNIWGVGRSLDPICLGSDLSQLAAALHQLGPHACRVTNTGL